MSTSDESEDSSFTPTYRFQKRDRHSDITLVIEQQRIHVHKTLLVLHSRVFERLLMDYPKEIPLVGRSYEAMVRVLEQIYPGQTLDLFKDDNLDDVLQLANEYEVHQVFTNFRHYVDKRLCEQTGKQNPDCILMYLRLVELYEQLRPLRPKLVQRASQIPAEEMETSEYFRLVPATAIRDVLMMQIKNRNATVPGSTVAV